MTTKPGSGCLPDSGRQPDFGRVILHCDCNNFFASVELLKYPELQDKPVAVAGDPEGRHGIILAKNMIAKRMGVQTAETIWQARKKCPDLVLVPPHHDEYEAMSRRVNEIYCSVTDQVEPFSVDESWLDVTGSQRLFGDGKTIADELRRRIREILRAHGDPLRLGHYVVLIPRHTAATADYSELEKDFKRLLRRKHFTN